MPAFAPDGPPVFRFAPSPNGPLHRGHALSALLNAKLAERHHGRFLLRIEDIDAARSRPEHIAGIDEALAWLGLVWEKPVRLQSQHMDDYERALEVLKAKGVLYPCFCTRGTIAADWTDAEVRGEKVMRDPDGAPLYVGRCRTLSEGAVADRLSQGEVPQWRLDTAKALAMTGHLRWRAFDPLSCAIIMRDADPLRWGDPVIARKGMPTSYHLSVVVDDALQGVTHIVRGTDLEASTDIHVLLQTLLGLPLPLYWHHPLILDADGKKLAKSKGSVSLLTEREAGLDASTLHKFASALLHQ